MLSLLVFFLMIAALPALCAVGGERKFEEILPLSCITLVLIAYVLGLLGLLRTVPTAGLTMAITCYLMAMMRLLRKKDRWRSALRRFFTPAFFLFLALFFYLAVLNYGRLSWEFDALSHWADVVKAMTQVQVLSTSPLSHSAFQSYPPGMSLFQYLSEELTILGGGEFAEWRLYHAYQVFVLAFLFPFFRKLNFKKAYGWLLAAALVLAPCFLFADIYRFLYVDPALGVVTASGLAMVLLETRQDRYRRSYALLCAAILVLIKDAGLVYALVLVALLLVAELQPDGRSLSRRLREKKGTVLAAVCAVLLPWASWKLSIRLNGAAVAYSDPIPPGQLLNVLLFRDQSYRRDVRDLFWTSLLENGSSASLSGVGLTYIVLIALLLTAFLFVLKRCRKRFPERAALFRWVFWLKLLEFVLYMLGILIMYLFKFSAYEALQLASLERYVAVPLLSIWLLTLLLAIELLLESGRDRNLLAALIFCAVLIGTPPQSLINLTNRESVAQSREIRAPLNLLEQRFEKYYSGEPARIYFLSQEDSEYAFYMAKFSFRPQLVSSSLGWSLGEPFYEGDVWTRPCTPEALQKELVESYDFVLVYKMNEDFQSRFASLFAEPGQIGENRIYRVDRDSGLLLPFAED